MIRVVVAEDEPLARARIVRMLKNDKEIQIAAECADGLQAVDAIQEHRPDLLFLDIQMPEMDGFALLEMLDASQVPYVIFVTAYQQYAVRAFEFYALDYLLKPFNEQRLLKALQRAREEINKKREGDTRRRILQLLDEVRLRATRPERILLKEGERARFVKVEDIDWIEADGRHIRIHFGNHTHTLRQPLVQLESRLDPAMFVRIHRATIVNVERIREIQSLPGGDSQVTLRDGTILNVGRTYRKNLA